MAEFIDARDDMYEIVGETRLLLFKHEAAAKDPDLSDLVRDFHEESAAAHKSLAESVEKDIEQYSAAIAKLQSPSRWIYWAGGLDDTRGALIQQRAAFLSIKRMIQAQKTMAEIQEQTASSKDKNAPVTSAGAEGQQRKESSAQ